MAASHLKSKNELMENLVNSFSLMEKMEAGIAVVTLSGKFEYVNASLCRLLNSQPEELLHRSFFDFIAEDSRQEVTESFAKRKEGQSASYLVWMQGKQGAKFQVAVAANPIKDKEGRITGAIATITQLKFVEPNSSVDRAAISSKPALPLKDLRCANLELYPQTIEYSIDGKKKELNVFAFKLLSYFIENRNKVITRKDLLNNVWGNDSSSERIIDVHIVKLRKKLRGFNGNLKTVYGLGYILKADERKERQI